MMQQEEGIMEEGYQTHIQSLSETEVFKLRGERDRCMLGLIKAV